MGRIAVRMGQVLVGVVALVWLGDYGAVRMRGEAAFGTVPVHRFLTTSLKGQKAEYDFLGNDSVRCSRSMFPQRGSEPCWWVTRHTTVWE